MMLVVQFSMSLLASTGLSRAPLSATACILYHLSPLLSTPFFNIFELFFSLDDMLVCTRKSRPVCAVCTTKPGGFASSNPSDTPFHLRFPFFTSFFISYSFFIFWRLSFFAFSFSNHLLIHFLSSYTPHIKKRNRFRTVAFYLHNIILLGRSI